MQKTTVTFAIIGCGDVTEKKSGPAFQKIPGSRLKTVMRRDEAKLKDYAARHCVEHYTTDYLEILNDPEIDAVYIATTPNMHKFYTLEAAKYGKAVYVEKPMALTVKECREMTAACEAAGVPLFTAYYRRGMEKFVKIREILSGGVLGELRSFQYQYACPVPAPDLNRAWLLDPKAAGGGLLYDIGSHMIDTLGFLLGEAEEACGVSANQSGAYAVNDDHSAVMRFQSGVQGTMQLCFCAAERRDEAVVLGSRGSLRFSIMDNEPITLTVNDETKTVSFSPMEHVQQELITRVVKTLLGNDGLESRGITGLRTQELLEAIDHSRPYRLQDTEENTET
jgi:1,5-anhydro-D-fructose reductase (1,5-anhydro-D-mannitol-forming)